MQEHIGSLDKMISRDGLPIQYQIPVGNDLVDANSLIGKEIHIQFSNKIVCKACGTTTKKSFGQGYCYPCFTTVPETAPCIISPEKCKAHEGIYRDKDFAEKHCLNPHYVYIALTANVKIGVTRETQIPTRWIDQGAVQALKVAKTPNRHTAGLIEVALKKHLADKTNWQKMLKNEITQGINLLEEKQKIKAIMPDEFKKFITFDSVVKHLEYPVNQFPKTIKSINLDKTPDFSGTLCGIKGQYLIFESGEVFNVRKHSGYVVKLSY